MWHQPSETPIILYSPIASYDYANRLRKKGLKNNMSCIQSFSPVTSSILNHVQISSDREMSIETNFKVKNVSLPIHVQHLKVHLLTIMRVGGSSVGQSACLRHASAEGSGFESCCCLLTTGPLCHMCAPTCLQLGADIAASPLRHTLSRRSSPRTERVIRPSDFFLINQPFNQPLLFGRQVGVSVG